MSSGFGLYYLTLIFFLKFVLTPSEFVYGQISTTTITNSNETKENSSNSARVSPDLVFGTNSEDPADIHFYLHSDSENTSKFHEIILNDVASLEAANFRSGERIVMITEGFGSSLSALSPLRNAYLEQGVRNVILIDASNLTTPQLPLPLGFGSYFAAMQHVALIGDKGADFINFLRVNGKIKDASLIHIIGQSLGAHTASSIGTILKRKYKMTLARVTGLDVAGPFNKRLGKNKFNKTAARFVDAIHSNIEGFGTPESLGHVDFYLNGGKGKDQLGCRKIKGPLNILCSHSVAEIIYRKTITKKNEFFGCKCKPNPSSPKNPCQEDKENCEDKIVFGEYVPTTARGNYYVKVNVKVKISDFLEYLKS